MWPSRNRSWRICWNPRKNTSATKSVSCGPCTTPPLPWHKSQHDAVRKRAKAVVTRMEKGDSAAAGELLEFLSVWLRDHMSVADRMMGAYLRNYLRFNTSLAS